MSLGGIFAMDNHAAANMAQDAMRKLWASTPNMTQPGLFDGSLADISCLDYLDYEQISYADVGVAGHASEQVVTLVLAEVLIQQAGFAWSLEEGNTDLLLYDEQSCWYCVCLRERYREAKYRSHPQFGRHAHLAAWIIYECIQTSDLTTASETKFNGILSALGYDHWRLCK